ncbi:dihydrolipoyl dehydrogenase family protein [Leifsonia poae]|uniref:Oxidoreductase n=1 Tax=Leifsonia poae TaxID=110933 RepID=A0A9W6HBW6_9MICO|nr:NAD(P)/FAD-dependent oxidoreductase [Leifsonia poae]GLJ77260.1 oxidoreductase [Leifsonia poae]
MATTQYDVIVIGAGAVGENVADRAVQGGMSTVIVESELVGGECSYWACMPSKALLRSGALLRAAQRVGGVAEAITGQLDVRAVLDRRDRVTSHWKDDGQVKWLEGAGIDLVRGHAVITAPREVTVTAADGTVTVLAARHAVAVSTGSAALLPDIPGLRESEPWTSKDATSAQTVPASLAILGGGVVAVEMATAYAGFGTRVQLIARSSLLRANEPFAGELVGDALRALGVTVHLDSEPSSVERTDDDGFRIQLSGGGTIEADELLVAVGRVPNTIDLGLEAFGLEAGAWLDVDDTMRVLGADGEPVDGGWLYGVGDVNHRALLTHQGKYQARAAGDAIAARGNGSPVRLEPWGTYVATADHTAVPQVTFTDPEVASVGLTAAAAREAGYRIRVVDYPISSVAGATIASDDYTGQARMVVDEDRQVILGVTFVGQDVGELLHSATIAVVAEVPLDRLWHAVPSYPTLSEVWLRLLETYGRPEE